MTERERGEEPPAPGHWRVMAQPMSAPQAPPATAGSQAPPAAAGSQTAPVPVAATPARSGGRPLIATLVCVGVLLLALAGQDADPVETGGGAGALVGYLLGGAFFGVILWGIAFAITIRKASTAWKAGSLIVLALLGALVSLKGLAGSGAAPAAQPVPVVRTGK